MTTLAPETLEFLRSVDSPTLANAVERFAVRDLAEGYLGGRIACRFPELGPMIGTALTVTMRSAAGPPDREAIWRMWSALDAAPSPSVLVIGDVGGRPHRVAYAGEIMATLAQRLGAVGIVSDAGLRDLDEVRALGMHYFMPFPVVSHAAFEVVDVGAPVELDGQRVTTGDLLHGDANGIVIVPWEVLNRLPPAVEAIRQGEEADLGYLRSREFSLDGYRRLRSYGAQPGPSSPSTP